MLQPNDTWCWYFCDEADHLMLDLGEEMLFKTILPRKLLVHCAFKQNQFTVDDAKDYQIFLEQVELLDLTKSRKVELLLNAVSARRFHKPVQPKSWFFDAQSHDFTPELGQVVTLSNALNQGHFMVLELGDNASLCMNIALEPFQLTETKSLMFCQAIKVMHDRMHPIQTAYHTSPIALVG